MCTIQVESLPTSQFLKGVPIFLWASEHDKKLLVPLARLRDRDPLRLMLLSEVAMNKPCYYLHLLRKCHLPGGGKLKL